MVRIASVVGIAILVSTASPVIARTPPGTRCRGVRVAPGDNVEALIDHHGQRATFCFARGTYQLSDTIWTARKYPTLDLRAGAVIDGQNGSFTGISGRGARSGRRGTVILGGTFQHFGNANDPGWIAPVILSDGWTVRRAEFRENFNSGLLVLGNKARVSSVHVHHNGQYGLSVARPCGDCSGPTGVIIENSEIAYNNTRQLDPGYDAGGTKFSGGTNGTIVRGNEIHDNYGSGVWFDSFHKNARIYDNIIYDNYRWGIFWEASYGSRIHHNSLRGNGVGDGSSNAFNGQLVVVDSDGGANGIEVYENAISGSAIPIALVDDSNRSSSTRSVFVHDNVLTLGGEANLVGGFGVDLFTADANNRFERNTYRVRDRSETYWAWNGQTLTWSQWRAVGHDNDGSLRVIG
jgi:parallel beta-helix repeat protein